MKHKPNTKVRQNLVIKDRKLQRQNSKSELKLVDRITFFRNWQSFKFLNQDGQVKLTNDESSANLMNTSSLNQNDAMVGDKKQSNKIFQAENVYDYEYKENIKVNLSGIQKSNTTDDNIINISNIKIDISGDESSSQEDFSMEKQGSIQHNYKSCVQKQQPEDEKTTNNVNHKSQTQQYRQQIVTSVQQTTDVVKSQAASQNSVIHFVQAISNENSMKQIKSKFSLQELEEQELQLIQELNNFKNGEAKQPTSISQNDICDKCKVKKVETSTLKSVQNVDVAKQSPKPQLANGISNGDTVQRTQNKQNSQETVQTKLTASELQLLLSEQLNSIIDEKKLIEIMAIKDRGKISRQLQQLDFILQEMINQLPKTSSKILLKQQINRRLEIYDNVVSKIMQ